MKKVYKITITDYDDSDNSMTLIYVLSASGLFILSFIIIGIFKRIFT